MKQIIKDKPLMMLTVGELMEVLLSIVGQKTDGSDVKAADPEKKYVYGVKGLAKLLNCSISTAQRRISSGILDKCIIRTGRVIMIDRDIALAILKGGVV